MAHLQNGKLTRSQLTKLEIAMLKVDKMTSWQNGKLTKWRVDKMAS